MLRVGGVLRDARLKGHVNKTEPLLQLFKSGSPDRSPIVQGFLIFVALNVQAEGDQLPFEPSALSPRFRGDRAGLSRARMASLRVSVNGQRILRGACVPGSWG